MTTEAARKVTHPRLLELVSYDPATGVFRWKVRNSTRVHVGDEIRTEVRPTRATGVYLRGRIDGKLYLLHRLAWFYVHGTWPEGEVDHINNDSTDNRISNLRDVSRAVNQQNVRQAKRNSTTGLLGVCLGRRGKNFRAGIRVNGKYHPLGVFHNPDEAYEAYVRAKRRLHEGCTL